MRMKPKDIVKVSISLLWYSGSVAGALLHRAAGRPPKSRLVVLYYHAVPAAARTHFARQMRALADHATVLRAAHDVQPGTRRRCVAITFDDAFHSVAEFAVPELLLHSFPATIFVPVGVLGRPQDWATEGYADLEPEAVMTAEDLRSLPESIELGSHSRTHAHLTTLDEDRLRDEIAGSRRELAELVGRPVTLFAFPFGEHDTRVVDACREAGYERAFSIVPSPSDLSDSAFVRGRISVGPFDSPLEFGLKVRGAYTWMPYASSLKSSILRRRGRP